MKKKIITLFSICVISVTALFATGIGIQGGSDVANSGNGSLDVTFKLDKSPLIFAVGLPSLDPLSIGVTGDYWIVNENLVEFVNYYVGVGGFASVYLSDNYTGLTIGPRIPVGLNTFFVDNVFEVYLQAAPGLAIGLGNGVYTSFVCPLNFGLRYWF